MKNYPDRFDREAETLVHAVVNAVSWVERYNMVACALRAQNEACLEKIAALKCEAHEGEDPYDCEFNHFRSKVLRVLHDAKD